MPCYPQFLNHILPQMKRMQSDWSRGVILSMSRRQDRFKVHQRRSQNPKHWGKHMPLYPGPVSWNQSLWGRIDVNPQQGASHAKGIPLSLWTPRSCFTCVGKHLLVFFFLLFLLCLSLTLSLTHTSNTCAHKQVRAQEKSHFSSSAEATWQLFSGCYLLC